MGSSTLGFLNKPQKYVIFAVTFGNILEWYDIYLYIYWAPTLAKLFFNPNSGALSLFNTVGFFVLGFFFRPLGGIIFGRLGDRLGRKKSFILSILLMTVPTFFLGLLPTYAHIGVFAPILLALTRILQTFPAGGELPGVFCYLYENADVKNRKFITSFAGVGNQIGIALGALEGFLFESYFTPHFLMDWGWRISFIVGGFIGLGSYYLRYKLHETKLFREMVVHHKVSQQPVFNVIKTNWKGIITGVSYDSIQTISFHLISILFPVYLYKALGVNHTQNFIASLIFLILMTAPLPVFGLLGDKWGIKNLLIGACVGMLVLLYPLYEAMTAFSVEYVIGIIALYALCLTCITAFLPYLISNLFSTSERYTCVGLSFNITDGILGGLSTLVALYILETTKNPSSLIWILLISCIVSLGSYIKLKDTVN